MEGREEATAVSEEPLMKQTKHSYCYSQFSLTERTKRTLDPVCSFTVTFSATSIRLNTYIRASSVVPVLADPSPSHVHYFS